MVEQSPNVDHQGEAIHLDRAKSALLVQRLCKQKKTHHWQFVEHLGFVKKSSVKKAGKNWLGNEANRRK